MSFIWLLSVWHLLGLVGKLPLIAWHADQGLTRWLIWPPSYYVSLHLWGVISAAYCIVFPHFLTPGKFPFFTLCQHFLHRRNTRGGMVALMSTWWCRCYCSSYMRVILSLNDTGSDIIITNTYAAIWPIIIGVELLLFFSILIHIYKGSNFREKSAKTGLALNKNQALQYFHSVLYTFTVLTFYDKFFFSYFKGFFSLWQFSQQLLLLCDKKQFATVCLWHAD